MAMRSLVSGRGGATRAVALAIATLLASALVVAPAAAADTTGGASDPVAATGSPLAGATLKITNPGKYGVVGSIAPTNFGNPSMNLESLVMAPVCPEDPAAQANSLYCIAGIKFESPVTGEMVSAIFDGYVEQVAGGSEVLSMPGDPIAGLPEGRSMTRWNLPGLPGSTGKTTYVLSAGLDLQIDPTSGMWGPTAVNGNPPTTVYFQPYDYGAQTQACMMDEDFTKIWSDGGGCARVVDYAHDARIQLTMVVPKYVGGWFSGRMGTPDIQLSDLSPTSNLLEITASTVSVAESPAITANQAMLDAVYGAGAYQLNVGSDTMTAHLAFGTIPLIAPFVDDAPQKTERRWNFTQYSDVAGACYTGAGQLQGFATTNAMQFQSSAPEFDTTTGQFRFMLSGFHYEADKTTEATGSYDFVVRREILDCLYGFEAASAITGQADVQDGAATQTGVSVDSVPGSDMVRISLQGFHFSSPETLIKFDGAVSTLQRFTSTPTPVMSSGIRVGTTVEVSTGGWDPAATLTYQWYLNGVAIAGANAAAYTPTPSQFNRLLSVRVRGSGSGYLSSTQSSSGKLVGASTQVSAISGISPTSAPSAGGALVTLTGSGFTGASSVTFGGVAGTSVTVISDSRLTVKAPVHAAGAVDVVVTAPSGASLAKTFTYVPWRFSDVSTTHAFYTQVEWLATQGITSGYDNGRFGVTDRVTRGQMAVFLYKLAGSPAYTPPAVSQFTDVPVSHPFYKYVSWLAAQGITSGYGNGLFGVTDPVTRGQMSVFLYKDAGSPAYTAPVSAKFPDVPVTHPFYKYVSWLAANHISNGYANGTFGPSDAVTRGQMAVFLYNYAHLP